MLLQVVRLLTDGVVDGKLLDVVKQRKSKQKMFEATDKKLESSEGIDLLSEDDQIPSLSSKCYNISY